MAKHEHRVIKKKYVFEKQENAICEFFVEHPELINRICCVEELVVVEQIRRIRNSVFLLKEKVLNDKIILDTQHKKRRKMLKYIEILKQKNHMN